MSEKPLLDMTPVCKRICPIVLTLSMAFMATVTHAQTIRIEGSSAGYGMSRAAAAAFVGKTAIQAGISGAAAGLISLCRGEAHLLHSSRPIQKAEQESCARAGTEFLELPIAFDAVAVIVNPRNSFAAGISLEELRTAFELKAQGRVTRWNQINAAWPETPLQLIGPDRQSDEVVFLSAAVLGGAFARQDYMASTEDGVIAKAVARDSQTLGLVSLAYYLQDRGRLKLLPVSFERDQRGVLPSIESISTGAYRPLSRPLFLYVNARALENPEIARFAEYYVTNAARFAREQSYVPLSAELYRRSLAILQSRTKGSVWEGALPVGVTLEALRKKYGV